MKRCIYPLILGFFALAASPAGADSTDGLIYSSGYPAPYEQGFNCGGDKTLVMENGTVYWKDREYSVSNGSGRIGGEQRSGGDTSEMGGILHDVQTKELVKSRVEGWQAYRFDVPNGTYMVTLHFMESTYHWSGLRSFSVKIEGAVEIDSLDIFAEMDRQYAKLVRRVVEVDDGNLNIWPVAHIGTPVLNAINVERIVPDTVPPSAPGNFSATEGYEESFIRWTAGMEPDELGALIWRRETAGRGELVLLTPRPVFAARFTDRTAESGKEYSYRAESVDAWGNLSPATSEIEVTPLSHDQSRLRVCAFEMTQEDLIYLNLNRRSDEYLPAVVHMDGETWEDAGLRYRGNSTRDMVKKNYKIRFPNDRPLPENRIKLNLQSEWRVPSPLREKLSYDIFEITGALAPHCEYMHMSCNGRFAGVYLDIEQVDEYFLENHGLSGTVWKASSDAFQGDFKRKSSLEDYYHIYTLETGEYSSYEYLDDLMRIVNETSDAEFRTAIRERLDIENFFNWYSSQAFISNWDHVIHNYYLFRDDTDGVFYFIPWDLELTWEDKRHAIDYGTRRHRWFFLFWNRLFDRLMNTPVYRRMYAAQLYELLEYPLSAENVDNAIISEHLWLRPEIHREPCPSGWSPVVYDLDLPVLLDFAEGRRSNILSQLADFEPDPTVCLFLNETVLLNLAGAVDEEGEHEPWIEVYNFGNENIDLDGLGLTDEISDPFKWTFPNGVSIGPGGHLVVWLDGEEEEGPLHASFRAGPSTEALALVGPGGDPVNILPVRFSVLADIPLARRPDGGGDLIPLANATPGSANDPVPLVALNIELSPEFQPGDTVPIITEAANHTAFPVPLELNLTLFAGPSELTFDSARFELEAWETRRDTVEKALPYGYYAGRAAVEGELRYEETGALFDDARIELKIRDPRPVPVLINEIMAKNDSTVLDESDQYDDWIELYNPASYRVQLGGLYLSDDFGVPRKWAFPEISIKPGGHLIVWCDDDTEQGPCHTNFKLSADGEAIGLYDLDIRGNAPLDQIVFGPMNADESYGRSPDGSPNLILLPYPTPGSANP